MPSPHTSTPDTVILGIQLPEALLALIREAAGPETRIQIAASEPALLPLMPEATILLAVDFTPAMLAAAPRLRWVHGFGAGVESLLFPAMRASKVAFTNARGAHRVAMPEYVLMAMLSWTHHLPALLQAQQRREWVQPLAEEVAGKTLGLLGYGEIGRAVAARAAALGVRCVAFRRHPQQRTGQRLAERVYGPDDLLPFLGACDFVVDSLPLTAETRELIGAREFAAMRPSAVFISLGRGATVNQAALLLALRTHQIAGAFLDVFDREPLAPDSPFWALDNAIITNHTSGNSVHYQKRSVEIFCDNLRRYFAGQRLRNVVNKRLGY